MKNERHRAVYGPAHQILESTSPLHIIIPSNDTSTKHFGLAETIAHDWFLYGRGDAEILHDDVKVVEAVRDGEMMGNMVVLGGPVHNRVTSVLLQLRQSAGN